MTNLTNVTLEVDDENGELHSDDAIWIVTSAFIIFTMQCGFGLLESGLVSRKNEVNIMVKNVIDVVFGGLAYWMFGFAISFGGKRGSNGFSGFGMFFTDAGDTKMGSIYAKYFFHLSIATTATTIVSGALAERTTLKAYMAFSFFNTLTYCFPAHWIWSSNGWLKKLGTIDVAGGSVVHIVGGASGLAATLYLGPRQGSFTQRSSKSSFTTISSPTNVILGTFMLWWGWLGHNCGSTLGVSDGKWELAARSAVCTINASIGGGICAVVYSYIVSKKLLVQEFVTGILGGLVGITAICTVTNAREALVIGAVGGLIACVGCRLLKRVKIDDPVGCVPVHLLSGVWSLIVVPFFAKKDFLKQVNVDESLIDDSRWKLLAVQIVAVVCCFAWASTVTFLLLTIINKFTTIRMSLKEEMLGADFLEHGIQQWDAYPWALNGHQSEFATCRKCSEKLDSSRSSSSDGFILEVNELDRASPMHPEGRVILHNSNKVGPATTNADSMSEIKNTDIKIQWVDGKTDETQKEVNETLQVVCYDNLATINALH